MTEAQIPSTATIAKQVADEATLGGLQIHRVKVEFVTDGLYAVEVHERGIPEPECFFFFSESGSVNPQ